MELAIFAVDYIMYPPPDSLLRALELDSKPPAPIKYYRAIAVIVIVVSSLLNTL